MKFDPIDKNTTYPQIYFTLIFADSGKKAAADTHSATAFIK